MVKYLHLWENKAQHEAYIGGGDYVEPYVGYDLENVYYNKIDPFNGHAYVEIGGLKWATMNVGAESETDYGLYFQWGDTQGYTSSQVGSGEGQKYFDWTDYKYGNGTSSPDATGMTKYNATDGLTTLEAVDDAAVANWGGSWRMPTTSEIQALGNAVTAVWTTDYNGSGINGLLCTDKTDSTKTLFFPAAGGAFNGIMRSVGGGVIVWSSSLNSSRLSSAWSLYFDDFEDAQWNSTGGRFNGLSVRPVVG